MVANKGFWCFQGGGGREERCVEREVLLESISSFLIYNQVLVEQIDFTRLELEEQDEFLTHVPSDIYPSLKYSVLS